MTDLLTASPKCFEQKLTCPSCVPYRKAHLSSLIHDSLLRRFLDKRILVLGLPDD